MTDKTESRMLDTTALKALAHPLRVQIIGALSVYGPATASGLADRLGESSGATSYHLRQLEKHGFVTEDTTRGTGRERWWVRSPGGLGLDLTDFEPSSAGRAASELVLAEWLRSRERLLNDFISRGEALLSTEWIEASVINAANLRLTSPQLQALVTEVTDVFDRYAEAHRDQQTPGTRPVQVHFNAFPVVDGEEVPS